MSRGDAKKKVLKFLKATGRFADRSADTLRKTLENKLARYALGGAELLEDGRKFNQGRTPIAASASEEDRKAIKLRALKSGSERLAISAHLADSKCSEALRAAMSGPRASKHNLPRSLRAVAHVTPEQKAFNRGAREYGQTFTVFRDGTAVFPDGERRPIKPGELLVYDDMSLNQPFFYPVNHRDDEMAKHFGVGMGRQVLFAYDFASGRLPAFDLIARPRDAYRKEDVQRILLRTIEDG